jgi:signal transduction histidine kinase
VRVRRIVGLRARLVVALVATSALTLGIAAFALLAPLERRLRTDEVENLMTAVVAARPSFAQLEPRDLKPGDPELEHVVHLAARRGGGEVIVLDEHGRTLAATDPDGSDPLDDARLALRTGRVRAGVSGGGSNSEARAAAPVRVDGEHLAIALRKPLNDVRSATAVVRRAVVAAALAGLAAAAIIGLGLAWRIVRRLRALRDTALRVARVGPVVEMTPDGAHDEVGDLTRAFAVMQDRLREQEQARRTFVSTASHELRTPLASLRLMLDFLAEQVSAETPDIDRVRADVASARGQAERLAGLAMQLLDLSRLDAGVPARAEMIDVGESCRSVLAEFAARAVEERRPVRLEAPGEAWAVGDPDALAQIVRILVDNALRFGPPGDEVVVSVEPAGHAIVIAVSDQGPGVSSGDAEVIFERFRRGEGTADGGGFGLGLAIGRELARRIDGDLVLAGNDGPGARFELRLVPAPSPLPVA